MHMNFKLIVFHLTIGNQRIENNYILIPAEHRFTITFVLWQHIQ